MLDGAHVVSADFEHKYFAKIVCEHFADVAFIFEVNIIDILMGNRVYRVQRPGDLASCQAMAVIREVKAMVVHRSKAEAKDTSSDKLFS